LTPAENRIILRMVQLVLYPEPILTRRASVVPDPRTVSQWVEAMHRIMKENDGIGIAAPQVGISERFFVTALPRDELRVFVNPEITDQASRMIRSEESCLSLPGITADLKRHAWVTVRYFDTDGESREMTARGLLARVIQHEVDHLNGVLFTDHLQPKRRERLLRRLERALAART
jgi:peptide deformylase